MNSLKSPENSENLQEEIPKSEIGKIEKMRQAPLGEAILIAQNKRVNPHVEREAKRLQNLRLELALFPDFEEGSEKAGQKKEARETLKYIEQDSRFESILQELQYSWEQLLGDAPNREVDLHNYMENGVVNGKRVKSGRERAFEIFSERFPTEAAEYDEAERVRVYEDYKKDPAVKKLEGQIKEINDGDFVGNNFNEMRSKKARAVSEKYKAFFEQYPEKTEKYAERNLPFKVAYEEYKGGI
ncbi:MAG: hypothetical protein PHF79_00030 [Candidatus Pacebacteria bacterium]|nr:hypothetical protein [Candidatus Paceibacterota bacterium]